MAARIAELDHVPVRIHPISRAADHDEFLKLLVSMNSQRVKTVADVLHETLIKVDPRESARARLSTTGNVKREDDRKITL